MKTAPEYTTYCEVKQRLDEIVKAVGEDGLAIEDALALYEEAVGLGLAASSLIEQDIDEQRELAETANPASVEGEACIVSSAVADSDEARVSALHAYEHR